MSLGLETSWISQYLEMSRWPHGQGFWSDSTDQLISTSLWTLSLVSLIGSQSTDSPVGQKTLWKRQPFNTKIPVPRPHENATFWTTTTHWDLRNSTLSFGRGMCDCCIPLVDNTHSCCYGVEAVTYLVGLMSSSGLSSQPGTWNTA